MDARHMKMAMILSKALITPTDYYGHVDKKWFYKAKQKLNYYLMAGEQEAIIICKSKIFITKVMFCSFV